MPPLVLFQLDSRKNFRREERSGIVAVGTGEYEFAEMIPKEIDHFTKQWARQNSGYKIVQIDGQAVCIPSAPGEKIKVDILQCSMVITAVADNIVESGNLRTVGGYVQIIKFTKDGFTPIYTHIRSKDIGKWRMATLPSIRSYSEIDRITHYIPSIDRDGNVIP